MANATPAPSGKTWNLPNQITAVRIGIALLMFVLVALGYYFAGMVLFILAASTDWVDGQIARRTNQVTQLGRILDPLADKVLICGSFIFLCAVPDSRIAAWMAVVVVSRELIVTVIRSFLEQSGNNFSANMPGKLKMVFQCIAIAASLWMLHLLRSEKTVPSWLPTLVTVSAWVAVLSTIYSGAIYAFAAARLLK